MPSSRESGRVALGRVLSLSCLGFLVMGWVVFAVEQEKEADKDDSMEYFMEHLNGIIDDDLMKNKIIGFLRDLPSDSKSRSMTSKVLRAYGMKPTKRLTKNRLFCIIGKLIKRHASHCQDRCICPNQCPNIVCPELPGPGKCAGPPDCLKQCHGHSKPSTEADCLPDKDGNSTIPIEKEESKDPKEPKIPTDPGNPKKPENPADPGNPQEPEKPKPPSKRPLPPIDWPGEEKPSRPERPPGRKTSNLGESPPAFEHRQSKDNLNGSALSDVASGSRLEYMWNSSSAEDIYGYLYYKKNMAELEPNSTVRDEIDEIFKLMPTSKLQNLELEKDLEEILSYFDDRLPSLEFEKVKNEKRKNRIFASARHIRQGAKGIIGHIIERGAMRHCKCHISRCPINIAQCSVSCPNNRCCTIHQCHCGPD